MHIARAGHVCVIFTYFPSIMATSQTASRQESNRWTDSHHAWANANVTPGAELHTQYVLDGAIVNIGSLINSEPTTPKSVH